MWLRTRKTVLVAGGAGKREGDASRRYEEKAIATAHVQLRRFCFSSLPIFCGNYVVCRLDRGPRAKNEAGFFMLIAIFM